MPWLRKRSVHDANAAYVQKLRVPEDASDDQIQAALNQLFSQNMEAENQSVLKMSTQDNVQHQEQLLLIRSSQRSVTEFKTKFNVQDQMKTVNYQF